MMKYLIAAILIMLAASCAPKDRGVWPEDEGLASKYRHLEERRKPDNAVDRIAIGKTGAAFYYDRRLWNVKSEDGSSIDFNTRRFTTAGILHYDEPMALTQIYTRLVESYGLKDARLTESELVKVNGQVVIFNRIEGKHGRKHVVILSYGYSNKRHTVITHANIYKGMLRPETESEIVDFLNGFAG